MIADMADLSLDEVIRRRNFNVRGSSKRYFYRDVLNSSRMKRGVVLTSLFAFATLFISAVVHAVVAGRDVPPPPVADW